MGNYAMSGDLHDEIQTRLAAIRNALYLIGLRSDDFHVLEYVKLAEEQTNLVGGALAGPNGRVRGRGEAA